MRYMRMLGEAGYKLEPNMACCEIMTGTTAPTLPPDEGHIPIYVDRSSKKVYYWNGTAWELIWEIATAGPGTPGVVSIDPNSPIKLGSDGTLQIDCARLKTQCNLATTDDVASIVTSTINTLLQSVNTTLQQHTTQITELQQDVHQLELDLGDLETRVTTIENWDLCAKTSGCGYDSGGGGGVAGVAKLIAGANITLNPPSGVGDVTISAAGGGGPVTGVTKLVAGTNITLSPSTGVGEVTINAVGGGGGGTAGVTKVTSASPNLTVSPASGVGNIVLTLLGSGTVTGDADNGFADIGDIRLQWGTFTTVTGKQDVVSMLYPFGAKPYVLIAMERNAGGWISGIGGPMPTVYGTDAHPTDPANKFQVSVVRVLNDAHAGAFGDRTKYEVAAGQWFGVGSKP